MMSAIRAPPTEHSALHPAPYGALMEVQQHRRTRDADHGILGAEIARSEACQRMTSSASVISRRGGVLGCRHGDSQAVETERPGGKRIDDGAGRSRRGIKIDANRAFDHRATGGNVHVGNSRIDILAAPQPAAVAEIHPFRIGARCVCNDHRVRHTRCARAF